MSFSDESFSIDSFSTESLLFYDAPVDSPPRESFFSQMRTEVFNAVLETFGEDAVLVIDSIEQSAITVRFLTPEDDQGVSRSYRRSADDYNYQGVTSALAGYMARTWNTDLQAMPALKSGDIAYIRGNVYRVTKIKPGLVSTDIHLNDTGEAAP